MTLHFLTFWLAIYIVTVLVSLHMRKRYELDLPLSKLAIYVAVVTFTLLIATAFIVSGTTLYLHNLVSPEYCKDAMNVCIFYNGWEKYSFIIVYLFPIFVSILSVIYYARKNGVKS